MDKIMIIALESKGFKNTEAIMQIVNATQNPVTALELLLGVYEQPNIPEVSTIRLEATFTSFDPLANPSYAVKYTFKDEKIKYVNYNPATHSEQEAKEQGLLPGWRDYDGTGYKNLYIHTGEFKVANESTSVERWIEGKR